MFYKLLTAYRVPGSATKNAQGKMEDVLLPAGTILEGRDFRQPVRKTQPDGTPKVIGYKIVQMFVMPEGYPIPPSNGLRLWPLPTDASRYAIYDATQPAQVVVGQTPAPAQGEGDDFKIVSVDTGGTGTNASGGENVYVVVNQLLDELIDQPTTPDIPVIVTSPAIMPRQRHMYHFVSDYAATVTLVGSNAKSWPVQYRSGDNVQVEVRSTGMLVVIPTDGGDLFFDAGELIKKGLLVPVNADRPPVAEEPAVDTGERPLPDIALPANATTTNASAGNIVGLFLLGGLGLWAFLK